jgi:Zn-dependent protease
MVVITLHEFSHAFIAYKCGDPTAKWAGRMTLNPVKHFDPLGIVMFALAGFGWAKPVPVDMRYFKKPKQGMALTALAGPVSNFVLALLALLCARLVYHQYGALWDFIFDLLLTTAYLSVGLGLFNLIPISPLDGSKVLFAFLPDSAYEKLMRYEKYGMIALLILVWLGVGDNVLSTAIYNVYAAMINFVFRGIV